MINAQYYRPEIDGLRAIAVLSVIFFHAGHIAFPGGYAGVDIFFVISGYLITKIILVDLEQDKFSLLKFYERRCRRLLPALFFVCLCTTIFAWFILLPHEFNDFAKSLLSVGLFSSNIYFWQQSGYFANGTDTLPLLHTWSLAVEEQFYVLFPLFLILLKKASINRLLIIFAFIICGSLALAEISWRIYPDAAFYLLPTRAWELLVGSLIAGFEFKKKIRPNNLLAFLGLTGVLCCFVFFDKLTPTPSVSTLLPVISSGLIISFARERNLMARTLSHKYLLLVGLASYSIYLLHQPILVFSHKLDILSNTPFDLTITIAIIVFMGIVTQRYIEMPFRDQNFLDRSSIFKISGIILSVLILFGSLLSFTGIQKQMRYEKYDLTFLDVLSKDNSKFVTGSYAENVNADWQAELIQPKILLIGDSFSQDMFNVLRYLDFHKHTSINTFYVPTHCGNLFVTPEKKMKNLSGKNKVLCAKKDLFHDKKLAQWLVHADVVFLVSSWKQWEADLLPESLRVLKTMTDASLVVFGGKRFPTPQYESFVNTTSNERGDLSLDLTFRHPFELLADISTGSEHEFIDVHSLVCGNVSNKCKIFDKNGFLKSYDGHHLTEEGVEVLGKELRLKLQNMITIN